MCARWRKRTPTQRTGFSERVARLARAARLEGTLETPQGKAWKGLSGAYRVGTVGAVVQSISPPLPPSQNGTGQRWRPAQSQTQQINVDLPQRLYSIGCMIWNLTCSVVWNLTVACGCDGCADFTQLLWNRSLAVLYTSSLHCAMLSNVPSTRPGYLNVKVAPIEGHELQPLFQSRGSLPKLSFKY